jgi:hypothetical protein
MAEQYTSLRNIPYKSFTWRLICPWLLAFSLCKRHVTASSHASYGHATLFFHIMHHMCITLKMCMTHQYFTLIVIRTDASDFDYIRRLKVQIFFPSSQPSNISLDIPFTFVTRDRHSPLGSVGDAPGKVIAPIAPHVSGHGPVVPRRHKVCQQISKEGGATCRLCWIHRMQMRLRTTHVGRSPPGLWPWVRFVPRTGVCFWCQSMKTPVVFLLRSLIKTFFAVGI